MYDFACEKMIQVRNKSVIQLTFEILQDHQTRIF